MIVTCIFVCIGIPFIIIYLFPNFTEGLFSADKSDVSRGQGMHLLVIKSCDYEYIASTEVTSTMLQLY